MTQLEDYRQRIISNLNSTEEFIGKSSLFETDRTQWKQQIGKMLKKIRKDIMLLDDGIKDLQQSQASNYVGSIKSFKLKIQKLQNDMNKKEKGQSSPTPARTPIIQTAEEKRQNAIQQLFNKGDQAIEDTYMAVTQMKKMTEQGIELAAKINLDLTAQIEQLDRMQDKVNDTESTLKKAQKNIKYFIKALECDKCMIGMLGLILLALVAVIVLAVKKNKGS